MVQQVCNILSRYILKVQVSELHAYIDLLWSKISIRCTETEIR